MFVALYDFYLCQILMRRGSEKKRLALKLLVVIPRISYSKERTEQLQAGVTIVGARRVYRVTA